MTTAYVDSSALLAVVFRDAGGIETAERLSGFSHLVSSNLLEAEVRTGFARRALEFDPGVLSGIEWIYPIGPLSQELARALAAGYLRGADLWHVATALYAFPEQVGETTFLTLDLRQQVVAAALGFQG